MDMPTSDNLRELKAKLEEAMKPGWTPDFEKMLNELIEQAERDKQ